MGLTSLICNMDLIIIIPTPRVISKMRPLIVLRMVLAHGEGSTYFNSGYFHPAVGKMLSHRSEVILQGISVFFTFIRIYIQYLQCGGY